MHASLELEWIGQDSDATIESPIFGGKAIRRPWVAQILGFDPVYGYLRHFIRATTTDYSRANSVGSRGVYRRYYLGPGLYEIKVFTSWRSEDRYFSILRPGASSLERIDNEAVVDWIGRLDYFTDEPEEGGDDAQDLLGRVCI